MDTNFPSSLLQDTLQLRVTLPYLLLSSSEDTAYEFFLQLMMQPQGRWVQCSDRTNTGVTAAPSRVSRKLSVSNERLWKPVMCWTTICIWKAESILKFKSLQAHEILPGINRTSHHEYDTSKRHRLSLTFAEPNNYVSNRDWRKHTDRGSPPHSAFLRKALA